MSRQGVKQMDDKKKTAPGVTSTEDGRTEKTTGGASVPFKQSTTAARGRQGLSALLLPGAENAQTAKQIAALTGATERGVSLAVQAERGRGAPICASSAATGGGYYLAADASELLHYIKCLRSRLANITATLTALETTLDEWGGQTTIDGW